MKTKFIALLFSTFCVNLIFGQEPLYQPPQYEGFYSFETPNMPIPKEKIFCF